jgi:hypothetical protein
VLSNHALAAAATPQDQAAKVKEFLADPNVTTCTLATTAISDLGLSEDQLPSFVRRLQRENKTHVKQGQLTLANRPFRVVLGERLEREFFLFDVEKRFGPYWWGSWSLHSYHKLDDKFYEFVLLEDGAKVAARPYPGPLGTIRVGKGNRQLEKIAFNGSVHSKGSVAAPIGTIKEHWTGEVTECQIPVGDYTAYLMTVTYDNLTIEISNNYHTDAQGRARGREPVYGMQVRQDKPYVLDFSNDPVVVFDQPQKESTAFSRGMEIQFAAVLVDPKLDIMIRGLDDTSVEVEVEDGLPNGQKYKRPKSLDPQVVITRADGEVVAQGVMPFGSAGTCRYTWRLPNDLTLAGNQEELTVTVTYDTQKLYGKVSAARKITIRK